VRGLVDIDRFTALIRPVSAVDFVSVIKQWLQDAHEAAAGLQQLRRNHRGSWSNNTSFGTDRYQYLLNTADSLRAELPGLEVDAAFQSVLLMLDRVGIYQLQMPAGPRGSVSDASDLRRDLLEADDPFALIRRRDAWLSGRELLMLPWQGTEQDGLTNVWVGQGSLPSDENRIAWDWLIPLLDLVGDGVGLFELPGLTAPPDPDAFEQPQPTLPIRPRSQRPSAAAE
jgi:hypothetical protein